MPCVGTERKVFRAGLEGEGFWRINVDDIGRRLEPEVGWTREGAVMTVAIHWGLFQNHRTKQRMQNPRMAKLKLHVQPPQTIFEDLCEAEQVQEVAVR